MITQIYKQKDYFFSLAYMAIIRQKGKVTVRDFRSFKAAKTWIDRESRKFQLKERVNNVHK